MSNHFDVLTDGFQTCQSCGYRGPAGHACAGAPMTVVRYPVPSSTPHTCPKCGGNGTADGLPAFGRTVFRCWPCDGTGIVWSPGK